MTSNYDNWKCHEDSNPAFDYAVAMVEALSVEAARETAKDLGLLDFDADEQPSEQEIDDALMDYFEDEYHREPDGDW